MRVLLLGDSFRETLQVDFEDAFFCAAGKGVALVARVSGRSHQCWCRWLGTALLSCVSRFKRVKGYAEIPQVMAAIAAEQAESQPVPVKKAA